MRRVMVPAGVAMMLTVCQNSDDEALLARATTVAESGWGRLAAPVTRRDQRKYLIPGAMLLLIG